MSNRNTLLFCAALLAATAAVTADLVRARDAVLAPHRPPDGTAPRADRALEVTSVRLAVDLAPAL